MTSEESSMSVVSSCLSRSSALIARVFIRSQSAITSVMDSVAGCRAMTADPDAIGQGSLVGGVGVGTVLAHCAGPAGLTHHGTADRGNHRPDSWSSVFGFSA